MTNTQLRSLRASMKLTQVLLAQKLNIHPITVANYERGRYPIPTAIALAVKQLASPAKVAH